MPEATTIAATDNQAAGRMALIKEFWSYFTENRGAVIGLAFFISIIIVAVFAGFIAPHSPNQQFRDALLLPPFWHRPLIQVFSTCSMSRPAPAKAGLAG